MWVWIAVFAVLALFACLREGFADPPPAGYILEEGIKYKTAKVVGPTVHNTTPDKCAALCTVNPECAGTQFRPNSNICTMLKDFRKSTPASSYNTYIKSGAPAVLPAVPPEGLPAGWSLFAADTQYAGETDLKTATVSDCMAACSGLPGCQGIGSKADDCRIYTSFLDEKKEITGYNTYKYDPNALTQ